MTSAGSAISGVAWDHRRCWGPLDASIAGYAERQASHVRWDRRSLYSFGEGDLADYAARYDLVIFDHPFVGEAARRGYLLDLAPLLSERDREAFARDSVGASWRSYWSDGGLWGLPIDAAAQTAVHRADLMAAHGAAVPTTLDEVFALADSLRSDDLWMAFPAKPTDLFCTFLSLVASMGATPGADGPMFASPETARQALSLLRQLVERAHPLSRQWNPIACFDHMASHDDIAYVPYAFNYINYATLAERALTFVDAPRVAHERPARTLLGGAGIGVSANAKDPEAAYAYAAHLCSPAFQSSTYVAEGGQPGSRTAWLDDRCNALTNDFLRNTLATLDNAYLRPTIAGFIPLFRQGTHEITQVIFDQSSEDGFIGWLNDGYGRLLEGSENRVAAQ